MNNRGETSQVSHIPCHSAGFVTSPHLLSSGSRNASSSFRQSSDTLPVFRRYNRTCQLNDMRTAFAGNSKPASDRQFCVGIRGVGGESRRGPSAAETDDEPFEYHI